MSKQEHWRVFCAVDLPHGVRERVLAHGAHLREAVPDAQASWSRPDNIHLTLKFLGDIPQTRVEILSQAVARATDELEQFKIQIAEVGVFPKHGLPRVLWIGINDRQGNLARLHARLEEECAKAGFPGEDRPFHPHLTVARLRKPQHARSLASAHKGMEFAPAEMNVSELLVIRSELGGDGPRYTVISRSPLNVTAGLMQPPT